ncbi:MAG TPA: hypothetical protein DGB85_12530 [Deltaproteobacteria bacterium]|nr:hypothetical protein [Deltaproteobacteria bacterium]
MKSFLLCLLLGSLLGCAAENESMGKLSKDRQNLAAKISDSEAQNVLIFNEGSAIVAKSEGSWNLRVSSFEPIQAIYVDNIPMTLAGRSFDFFIQIPYELKSDREIFTVEVYTTENVIKHEILLKHKPS